VEHDQLEDFCAETYSRVVGSMSLLCGDRHVAEELAQDAFARLCRDWWRVRRMDHPEAWLHRVAINLAASRWRRRAAEARAKRRLEGATSAATPADHAADLALRNAISGLPPRQRSALVLRYYLDLPFAEIARLMEVKESTAKSLVAKALDRLRAQELADREVADAVLDG
jgi:RNA polymerase sigma-70 factor (ECF subfamily)